MPTKVPNTVSTGMTDGWHSAKENFGSRNPDNPDDPGTLDDAVDIQEPSYDDSKAQEIEAELARKDGLPPLEDKTLVEEHETLAIEEPNAPNPF